MQVSLCHFHWKMSAGISHEKHNKNYGGKNVGVTLSINDRIGYKNIFFVNGGNSWNFNEKIIEQK